MSGRTRRSLDSQSVGKAYAKLSTHYDLLFDRVFEEGRRRLFAHLPADRPLSVLEVGVGTGLSMHYYSPCWRTVGIDFSPAMLAKAVRRRDASIPHRRVELLQMDATHLAFRDGRFDAVVAVYVMSAMPEPQAALAEMKRVLKPDGTMLLLNHFLNENKALAWVERRISPWCVPIGFRTDLEMEPLVRRAGLAVRRLHRVNLFGLWNLVECVPMNGSARHVSQTATAKA